MKNLEVKEKVSTFALAFEKQTSQRRGIEIETLKDIELFDDEMLNKC